MALLDFAGKNQIDLTITKEGMYPEFTMNGIEYTAERFYGRSYRFPVAMIRCTAKHPEELEPEIPRKKRWVMKLVHYGWLYALALVLLYTVLWRTMGTQTAASWFIWLCAGVLVCVGVYRFILFAYNHYEK